MPLTGPGFYYLSKAQQLPTPEERFKYLEAMTIQGSLDVESATEIAQAVDVPAPGLDHLRRLGKIMGDTPLFVPRFARHRDTTVGAVSGFALRLRELLDKPAAASTQAALKRIMDRHRSTIQGFDPRARTEWGLIVRLVLRQVNDPVALEAGMENILSRFAAAAAAAPQHPHAMLQEVRRQLLLNVLEHDQFDAVYRYTRDNAVNAPLRQYYGKDNIPGEVMATQRPHLRAEAANQNRAAYEPMPNVTTGEFISSMDRALGTLGELQGQDNVTLYRATLFREPWVDAMVQSGQFIDHGYVSTSRYTEKLTGFFRNEWSTRYEDEVPVLMVFESSRAVDVSCLSRFVNESEHVIPRGEKFHARFLGSRRELCPGADFPDEENWAVFMMTDDGHEPTTEMLRTLKQLGA